VSAWASSLPSLSFEALEAQTAGALNETLGDLPIKRIARSDPRRRAARIAAARRGVRPRIWQRHC
jgi:hypothetical protein